MSPSFPKNYGDNLDCKLTLKISQYNNTEITYDTFSIESTQFILLTTSIYVDVANIELQNVEPDAVKRFLKFARGEESKGEGENWT